MPLKEMAIWVIGLLLAGILLAMIIDHKIAKALAVASIVGGVIMFLLWHAENPEKLGKNGWSFLGGLTDKQTPAPAAPGRTAQASVHPTQKKYKFCWREKIIPQPSPKCFPAQVTAYSENLFSFVHTYWPYGAQGSEAMVTLTWNKKVSPSYGYWSQPTPKEAPHHGRWVMHQVTWGNIEFWGTQDRIEGGKLINSVDAWLERI